MTREPPESTAALVEVDGVLRVVDEEAAVVWVTDGFLVTLSVLNALMSEALATKSNSRSMIAFPFSSTTISVSKPNSEDTVSDPVMSARSRAG